MEGKKGISIISMKTVNTESSAKDADNGMSYTLGMSKLSTEI